LPPPLPHSSSTSAQKPTRPSPSSHSTTRHWRASLSFFHILIRHTSFAPKINISRRPGRSERRQVHSCECDCRTSRICCFPPRSDHSRCAAAAAAAAVASSGNIAPCHYCIHCLTLLADLIVGVSTHLETQIVFYDSPGILDLQSQRLLKLPRPITTAPAHAVSQADHVLLVIDASSLHLELRKLALNRALALLKVIRVDDFIFLLIVAYKIVCSRYVSSALHFTLISGRATSHPRKRCRN
jgi:hypothetical protein